MKTMITAADINTKKRFQKPNILRKKPKPPLKHIKSESLSVKSLVTSTEQETKLTVLKQCPVKNIQTVQMPIIDNNVANDMVSNGELYQIDGNVDMDRSLAVTCDVLTNNNEENVFEATINVDSFINNSEMEQMVTQADVENELGRRMKQEWCLDFINDTQEIIIEDIDGSHLGSLRLASSPASPAGPGVTSSPAQPHTAAASTQNITLEYMNCTMNFKCNIPNCSKRFRSEEALNKHRSTHTKVTKAKVSKTDKPVVIECPVTKVFANGVEERCRVHCSSKKEIVNHLNEAHDPADAMYICAECGRGFYWAAGLRAHSRTHLRGAGGGGGRAGGAWACGWAGCGRVFRQPCRLREHMRAHTGDKPYPCHHPNCGWSFRTASKLLRHARRHTGERRHACEQCGRAFRRREHLRDHAARHHAHKRACTHAGCQKKFHTVEALQAHLMKVHKEHCEIDELLAATAPDVPYTASQELQPKQETFMVSLNSPSLGEETLEEVDTATLPTDMYTEAEVKTEAVATVMMQGAELALKSKSGKLLQLGAQAGMMLQAEAGAMCFTNTEAGMILQTEQETGMMLQTEAEASIMLQTAEAGMMIQTESETGMTIQTGSEASMMIQTEPEAGMMIQTGPEAGMMMQTGPEASMMIQTGSEADMMIRTGSEAGMMIQTGSEASMMIQTEPEAGMMIQTGPEAGMMMQTGPEASMMIQTGSEADMMIQTGPEAGMMLQTGPEASMLLQTEAREAYWRAARTHCTWPFPARDAEHVFEENAHQEYVLEDDTTEEISERSESNIYTIRSDLFLHGNVLNNEDSEEMGGAGAGEVAGEGAGDSGGEGSARGAGLLVVGADSLLDAHPTIDLMQEELLYTDAAVDESSFRVFLLSGEELT